MSSLTSINLKNRRQELQNQRRLKYCRALWRSLIACSLATGLFWAIALPEWAIEQETQIEIEGNQFLSEAEIRSLLSFSYPQPILQLQTQRLIQRLKATAPVDEAAVTRQLFPPKLTIKVRERPPVAMVLAPEASQPGKNRLLEVGFLDEQGIFVPRDFYTQVDNLQLPALKVLGFSEQYRPYWPELYQLISHSSIKIEAVNWQNPSNLVLETELGTVRLGANPSLLPEQLAVLSRLQPLPAPLNKNQIVVIDLTNPYSPEIQLSEPSK